MRGPQSIVMEIKQYFRDTIQMAWLDLIEAFHTFLLSLLAVK